MKKLSILLATSIIILFTSCNKNEPEKVAEKWLTSFLRMDYETAQEYSTKETADLLKIFRALNDVTLNDSARNAAQKIKVDVKDSHVEGDNATVTYTSTMIPEEQTIYLVREKGEWLVQLSKTDMFKDPDMPADPDFDPNVVADTSTVNVVSDSSATD